MEIKSAVPSEAVNQAAVHTLFVEGNGPEAIDPIALKRLLNDTGISVKTLGASFHVKSAAQALHPHHQSYYFIIDRDHHGDAEVNSSWRKFPNPDTSNLLIWKKRELENYFIDPDYLCRSQFLTKCNPTDLKKRLLTFAANRVFFDLANQTIAKIRELQKEKWIEDFTNPASFQTAENALNQLKASPPLLSRLTNVSEQLKLDAVETIFRELERDFLDGVATPRFGKGKWLDRMRGKPLLSAIINECFHVTDGDGKVLTGKQAVTVVAEDLLQQDLTGQPDDFQQLHQMISDRVKVKA